MLAIFAYSNNGLSFRSVASDYVAQAGEVVFTGIPTSAQLSAAFSGYTAAIAAQSRAPLIASAQAALDRSDTTIVRCASASVAVPAAWQTYRSALRAIVNGSDTTSTQLPATPAYPSGT
jgi:hypothetical protein